MKTAELFETELQRIPKEVRMQSDLCFGISHRIDQTLKERGMSQKDLAKIMGKSETEVSRWLSGMHNFTIGTIARISAALSCNLIEIAEV